MKIVTTSHTKRIFAKYDLISKLFFLQNHLITCWREKHCRMWVSPPMPQIAPSQTSNTQTSQTSQASNTQTSQIHLHITSQIAPSQTSKTQTSQTSNTFCIDLSNLAHCTLLLQRASKRLHGPGFWEESHCLVRFGTKNIGNIF